MLTQNKAFARRLLYSLLLVALATAVVPGLAAAQVQSPGPAAPSAGAVVILKGTSHLWVADDQGVLHWAGDTRALSGKSVDWAHQTEVTLDQIRGFRRGAPWLTAGLLKLGDPIYFVKWESNEQSPKLLHIESIADVELFGIDTSNYGSLVMEQSGWERRYSFPVGTLQKGILAPAAPVAVAAVVAVPAPATSSSQGTQISSGRVTDRIGYVSIEGRASPAKRYVLRVTSSGTPIKFSGSTSWSQVGNQSTPYEVEIQLSNSDRDLDTKLSTTSLIYAIISKDGTTQDGTLIVEIVETGPSSYISKETPYSASRSSSSSPSSSSSSPSSSSSSPSSSAAAPTSTPVPSATTAPSSSGGGSGGCGSRGGPGYRLPSGKCASWSD